MSLAAALDGLTPSRVGGLCATCSLLARLDEGDAAALRSVLAVPKGDPARVSSQRIADTLLVHGHAVGEQSISKHRRANHG